jgi:hypothetical protein
MPSNISLCVYAVAFLHSGSNFHSNSSQAACNLAGQGTLPVLTNTQMVGMPSLSLLCPRPSHLPSKGLLVQQPQQLWLLVCLCR